MSSPKVWFITGSSSGFGRAMVELVLAKGDTAVATLRKPEAIADLAAKHPSDKLLVLKLDVVKPEEIKTAFSSAIKQFGRIDVVFNNAAFGTLGEVESTPDDKARAMFDVNFFGAANVSKEAVRVFRDVNKPQGGKLIQVSSMAGYRPPPALAYYAASKLALEGLSEGLAVELDPEWNIKITIISPGGFVTNGLQNMQRVSPHPAYVKPTLGSSQVRAWLGDAFPPGTPPVAAGVEVIYKVAELDDPPLHFPLGKDAVEAAKAKAKIAAEQAVTDKWASWSDNLGPGAGDVFDKLGNV